MSIIKEAKFGKLKDILGDKKYLPSFFIYKKQLYKFELTKSEKREIEKQVNKGNNEFINNFENGLIYKFIRVIYSLIYKNETVKNMIENNIDNPFTKTNKIIFKKDVDVFFDDGEMWGKFSENIYVNLFANQNGTSKHLYNLLCIVSKVVKESDLKGLKIYVCDQELYDSEEYNKELKRYLFLYRKEFNIKDGNRFIAYLDSKIFNEKELLLKKINNKFATTPFIGEINLKECEKDALYEYTNKELKKYNISPNNFTPRFEKMFALGLVKQAYESYKGKNFWDNLAKKTGVKINSNHQARLIKQVFKNIMLKNNKAYDDSSSDHYHNVLMHCFVSKAHMPDFFDYLFAYWNLDLDRNIEGSLYDVNGKFDTKYFNESLFSELKNDKDDAKVKLHTKLAIRNNEKVSRNRIKQIIKIINDLWFDETSIDNYGIAELINEWKDDKNHDFYKLRNKEKKEKKVRKEHEVAYHSPYIKYNERLKKFMLCIPRQRIKELEEHKDLVWKITGFQDRMEAPYSTSRGFYTDSFDLELQSTNIFNEIKVILVDSENNKYTREFIIRESSLRIFDANGYMINIEGQNAGINEGYHIMFSNNNKFPEVLDNCIESENFDDIYCATYEFKKGDIVIVNDSLIKVGLKTESGLSRVLPIDSITATVDNENYELYNELPSYLFFANKTLVGSKIFINDIAYNIESSVCEAFPIKDELNEKKYGYLLDLSKFINDNGIYDVKLNITGNKYVQQAKFIFVKDFKYEFKNAPYLYQKSDNQYYGFKETKRIRVEKGTIEFPVNFKFVEDTMHSNSWRKSSTIKWYDFTFATNSKDLNANIVEDKLYMHLYLNDKIIDLGFTIPTLYWKKKESDSWSCSEIGNITVGEIKKFYLKGPFNFNSYVYLKNKKASKEKIERSENGNFYSFSLEDWTDRIKNDRDSFSQYEEIVIDEPNEIIGTLFSIVCKSSLSKIVMCFVGDRRHVNIKFNIVGSNNYVVTVKDKNGNIVVEGEEIQYCVNDDNFKYEVNFMLDEDLNDDNYQVTVYESDSDLFDFEEPILSEVRTTTYHLEMLEEVKV